jgi:putative NADH-flavin reductase
MPRLLILGATGPSGILLIREALRVYDQCIVVVYARSPEKLPEDLSSNNSVIVIKGDLTDREALAQALEGVDAVLSALGPGTFHPPGTPLAKAYEDIVDLLKEGNVKRIVLLGTASIKDPKDKFSLTYASLIKGVATLAPRAYADIVAIGEVFRNKGEELDWTIVRVPILTNGDNTEVVAGYTGDGRIGTTLARKGFAAFAVEEVEGRAWVQERPLISSK